MLNGENNFKIKVSKEIKSCDAEFCQACNKCDTTYVYQAENINEIELGGEIKEALKQGQLVVYYQPKYSLQDESLIGAEALVRWQHPRHGLLEPEQFLHLAERQGLMAQLDLYVWQRACARLHQWHKQGYNNLQLSVNVSRDAWETYDLVQLGADFLKQYAFKPEHLHLEISEDLYAQNPVKVAQRVKELRGRGFVMDLDDFGFGCSSLAMLSQLPLDVLKLDKDFVSREAAKPYELSLLSDIISIAHHLNLSVVAEGVETREQMKRLQVLTCDFVQGFFFAKPMPAEEFELLLSTQRLRGPRLLSSYFPQGKHHRILVVDENEHYANLIKTSFGDFYEIIYVDNPEAATELLSSEQHSISIVILSMTLPNGGANVIFKQVRQLPGNWHVPIVATIPNGNVAYKYPLLLEADDFLCKAHPVADLRKRVDALLDMLSFNERERILREEASRDFLTGLYNRRGLQAALSSLRKEDFPLALCLFDLDNLKQVNDTYGHDAGDRFIEAFADIVRHKTRLDDIQCRYGGDEFILLLKCMENEEFATKKAQEICKAFTEVNIEEGVHPSASVGIVMCSSEKRPNAHFIEQADKAMYKAKALQRGSCYIWHGDFA